MEGIELSVMNTNNQAFPIRYADDIIVLAKSQEELEQIKEVLISFLKVRGLKLNAQKTIIVPIEQGFDMLGFNLREYKDPTRKITKRQQTLGKKGIVIIKPTTKAIENFKAKIRNVLNRNAKTSAYRLIMLLNPIIRGWSNYFKCGGG
jgi:RNA-directed DNA polymerase